MHDLNVIFASRVPIVVVETHEERRFLSLLEGMAQGAFGGRPRPLFCWSVTDGLRRIDIDMGRQLHNAEPAMILKHIRSVPAAGVYVLLDFHPYLDDPVNVRLLKDIAAESADGARTVVLLSHALQLPAELDRFAARFEMSLPDHAQRLGIIDELVTAWNRQNPGAVRVDPTALGLLVKNLSGLTHADVERLARNAVHDGAVVASDLPEVMQAKYQLLNREGTLSFEYDTARFSQLAGLSNLKTWIEQRRAVMQGRSGGLKLDPPKGLLLIGVQGCGKSLAAKAAAGILGVPLLRLDIAGAYDKFHGETERKLRESLKQAEVMAPCVLWLDEIEKGLATGSGDSGVSRRILGMFLTWMAEHDGSIFVVATANDISQLPPELVRKGRFDEIFFVDLPTPGVRVEVFRIHLERRGLDPAQFDIVKLVQESDGFSGAEIEQAVVASCYAAQAEGQSPTTTHLCEELQRTRPLSVVMAERIAALRAWADGRTVPAD